MPTLRNKVRVGISSQLLAVRTGIEDFRYDAIVLVETWFDSGISSSEVFNEAEWFVIRCDRCDTGDRRRGGGVLVAVRLSYSATILDVCDGTTVEQVWIRIKLHDRALLIGAAYVPPLSQPTAYEQLLKSARRVVEKADPKDYTFFFGDFNCPVRWHPDVDNPKLLRYVEASPSQTEFFDCLASLGLSQICDVHQRNQLDLIFTDIDSNFSVRRASRPLKHDSHHHASIECSIMFLAPQSDVDADNDVRFDFYKANIPGISAALSQVNWTMEFESTDIDQNVAKFYEIIGNIIERNVPKKGLCRRYRCEWMTPELAARRNRRNRAYRSYIRNPSQDNLTRFVQYRNAFMQLNVALHRAHLQYQAELIRSNPSKFWKIVNSRRNTGGIPRIVRHNDLVADDPRSGADLFAGFFESVYAANQTPPTLPEGPSCNRINSHSISREEVHKALTDLDVS